MTSLTLQLVCFHIDLETIQLSAKTLLDEIVLRVGRFIHAENTIAKVS